MRIYYSEEGGAGKLAVPKNPQHSKRNRS